MSRAGAVRWAGGLALVVVVALLALRMLLQPERLTGYALTAVGNALGLQITAGGVGEYRLRGSPLLVARDVVARAPGSTVPVLRARRVLVQVPWSTVRSRGAVLDIERIELDGPVVDVGALQQWLAARPASDGDIPTLRRGLQVRGGRVDGSGWSLRRLDLDLPALHAGKPVTGHVRGQALSGATRAGFDLALAMTQPADGAGFAAYGAVTARQGDVSVPMRVHLSGRALSTPAALRVAPLRVAVAGTARGTGMELPFAAAVDGPARLAGGTWTFGRAGYALRGEDPLPQLDARGRMRFGDGALGMALRGNIARWPASWPAVPPLSASDAPLAFTLDYRGRPDLADSARLQLDWAGASADVAFRLPEALAWAGSAATGSPLPPLTGTLRVPVLEVADARLEGVEIEFEDDAPPAEPAATSSTP